MDDDRKTKQQLKDELRDLRRRLAQCEHHEAEQRRTGSTPPLDAGELSPFGIDVARRKAEGLLHESQNRLLRASATPTYIAEIDEDGIITFVNRTHEKVHRDHVLGTPITSWFPDSLKGQIARLITGVFSLGESASLDYTLPTPQGERSYSAVISPIRSDDRVVRAIYTATDITERKYSELEEHIAVEFLGIVNASVGTRDLIQKTVGFFQQELGCEAIGIRLREGNDYPYYETRGFSQEFVQLENSLCVPCGNGEPQCDNNNNPVLECMCGNVICGRFDSSKPFFTQRGSFWTNSTTELLASTTEADRQSRTRNRCNGEGYESVALIPLVSGHNRLGLLQLNDHSKGRFSVTKIALFERLAGYVAVAVSKFRAEEKLRESEERHRAIISSTPDHLLVQDRELRYTQVINPQLGLTEQDMLGRTDADFLAPLDAAKLTEVKRRVLETGQEVHFETSLVSRTGQLEFFDGTYVAKRDSAGLVDGVVGYFRNVTDRKRNAEALRKSEECYRSLFEQMTEGFALHEILCDEQAEPCDYRFLDVNPAFEQLTGLRREAVVGKTMREVLPEERNDWLKTYGAVALTGRSIRFERYSAALGRHYDVVAYRPAPGQFAVVFSDVTERKAQQRELERLNRLYAAISELNQVLVRIASRDELFNELCRIATQRAGFQLAWVGRPEDETHRVVPVARYGAKQGYLDEVRIYADDRPEGRGPTGNCIRKNKICVVDDVVSDCCMAPWYAAAETWGFRAVAAIPIRFQEKVWGALTIYDSEANVFQDKEQALLEEVGAAISFALNGLDHELRRRQAEEKLIASEADLREAQEIAMLGSYVLDIEHGQWSSSDVLNRIFGIPSDYVRTVEGWGEILHPEDRQAMLDYLRNEVLGKGMPFEREYRIVRHDDRRVRWVHGLGRLEFDASGRPAVMSGTVQDVTVRKQAEDALRESSQFNEEIITSAQEGIIVYGTDLRYQVWNPYMEQLSGLPACDVLGHHPLDVFPFLREAGLVERLEQALAGEIAQTIEIRFHVSQSGRAGWAADTVAPLRNPEGKIIGVIGMVRDITEQKRIEEELLQAKNAADAANRAKSEFLANMSHEIRTPMTAILGYTDVLLESDQTPPDHHEHLQIVQRNGQSLLELINTILDLAKIESGGLDVERRECSVPALVDEVVSLMAVQARKKRLSLEAEYQYPLPQEIQTDPARLRQILVNLVGNAIKFTERGSVRIAVSLAEGEGENRTIQFAVRDTGIGISEAQREKLFRPFSQVDSAFTRKYGGTGLGLVISQRFAEMLGGNIQLESQPGLGSTFTLRIHVGSLPNVAMLRSRMVSTIPPAVTNTPERLQGRILLAEDGVDNQRMIKLLLEKAGLKVDVAENGLEACRKATCSLIEGTPYELILMDIQMPAMDGYEATARLRQLGWRRPIVALTANAMVGDREKCLSAGCDDYLAKPVDRPKLLALIARYLPVRDQPPPCTVMQPGSIRNA